MDAIELAVGILADALEAPVMTDIPMERPQRLVTVDLDGDESTEFILRPRLALTCWGTSDKDAHGLALSAVQALQEAAETHPYLSAASLDTMSREEWSRNGQGRYLALVTLTINTDE